MSSIIKRMFVYTCVIFFYHLSPAQQANGFTETSSILTDQIDYSADLLPSPEAASLGQFINTPVSHYTGIPNISIPLLELKGKETSLPISLKYHSNGHKVADRASFVGLGWALEAGGMISRVVRGLPDEHPLGLHSNKAQEYFNTYSNLLCNSDISRQYLDSIASGLIDIESDIFFFSLPSESGKFTFKRSSFTNESSPFGIGNNPVLIPIKATDISYSIESNPILGNPLAAINWIVKTSDGTTYEFKHFDGDISQTSNRCDNSFSSVNEYSVQNAWHLSKIISPNNYDVIEFEYTPESVNYHQPKSYTEIRRSSGLILSSCEAEISLNQLRLSSIRTSWGDEVKFIAETDRLDFPGAKALDRIEYYYQGNLREAFDLTSTYFEATLDEDSKYSYNNYKLKLESIQQVSPSGMRLPPYQFFYAPGSFPSISSFAYDHWGYYNGLNEGPLPAAVLDNTYYDGASREPSLIHTKSGVLTKIAYPTGGTTTFDYELHDYFEANNVQGVDESRFVRTWVPQKVAVHDGIAPFTDTKTFTVNPIDGQNKINVRILHENPCFNIDGECLNMQNMGIEYEYFIRRTDGSPLGFSWSGPLSVVQVEPGEYQILVRMRNTAASGEDGIPDFTGMTHSLSFQYEQFLQQGGSGSSSSLINLKAGGLRIKSITAAPELGRGRPITKYYSYKKQGSNDGSGRLAAVPKYMYQVEENSTCDEKGPGVFETVTYRSSASSIPLNFIQGSTVGYNLVTEYSSEEAFNVKTGTNLIDGGEINANAWGGKTEHYYIDEPSYSNEEYPFVSSFFDQYKNGMLNEIIEYKWDKSNGWIKTHRTVNQYSFEGEIKLENYSVAKASSSSCENCDGVTYKSNIYRDKTARIQLKRTDDIAYSYEGGSTFSNSLTKQYTYNDYNDAPSTIRVNGVVKDYIEHRRYAYENSGEAHIDYLYTTGQKDFIIERKVNVMDNGVDLMEQDKAISSSISVRNHSTGRKYHYDAVADNNNYTSYSTNAGSLVLDNNMYENSSIEWDSSGNIKKVSSIGEREQAYIYSYNQNKRIAEATATSPQNIAFASFEDLRIENRDEVTGVSGRWELLESSCLDDYQTNISNFVSQLDNERDAEYGAIPDSLFYVSEAIKLNNEDYPYPPEGLVCGSDLHYTIKFQGSFYAIEVIPTEGSIKQIELFEYGDRYYNSNLLRWDRDPICENYTLYKTVFLNIDSLNAAGKATLYWKVLEDYPDLISYYQGLIDAKYDKIIEEEQRILYTNYISCLENSILNLENGNYTLNGSIRTSVQNTGDYILSFKAEISGSITVNGNSYAVAGSNKVETINLSLNANETVTVNANNLQLDHVRLHPKGSSMTSYTYDERGRMISIDNASGISTFYEYDDFNRLVAIKDHYGNIIRTHKYKYKLE